MKTMFGRFVGSSAANAATGGSTSRVNSAPVFFHMVSLPSIFSSPNQTTFGRAMFVAANVRVKFPGLGATPQSVQDRSVLQRNFLTQFTALSCPLKSDLVERIFADTSKNAATFT
jgi:hypothetical protein